MGYWLTLDPGIAGLVDVAELKAGAYKASGGSCPSLTLDAVRQAVLRAEFDRHCKQGSTLLGRTGGLAFFKGLLSMLLEAKLVTYPTRALRPENRSGTLDSEEQKNTTDSPEQKPCAKRRLFSSIFGRKKRGKHLPLPGTKGYRRHVANALFNWSDHNIDGMLSWEEVSSVVAMLDALGGRGLTSARMERELFLSTGCRLPGTTIGLVQAYCAYDVELFRDAGERNTWRPAPNMKQRRACHAVVPRMGNQIIAIGGFDGASYLGDVELLVIGSSNWCPLSPLAVARADAACAVVGLSGDVYVCGGRFAFRTDALLDTVECLRGEARASRWVTVAPMLQRRKWASATSVGGKVFVFGGFGDNLARLKSAEVYDPDEDQWARICDMPEPRYCHKCENVGDRFIFIVGGWERTTRTTRVLRYDTIRDVYDYVAPMRMAHPRSGFDMAALGSCLYIVGGWEGKGMIKRCPMNSLERYDPTVEAWTRLAPCSSPRNAPSLAALGGSLFACGGIGRNYNSSVEVYKPP